MCRCRSRQHAAWSGRTTSDLAVVPAAALACRHAVRQHRCAPCMRCTPACDASAYAMQRMHTRAMREYTMRMQATSIARDADSCGFVKPFVRMREVVHTACGQPVGSFCGQPSAAQTQQGLTTVWRKNRHCVRRRWLVFFSPNRRGPMRRLACSRSSTDLRTSCPQRLWMARDAALRRRPQRSMRSRNARTRGSTTRNHSGGHSDSRNIAA